MALTPEQHAALEKLGPRNLRQQLDKAGPGRGSTIPGIGDGMILRGDAQDYLRKVEEQETALLKAAAWISAASIIVSIVIAWLQSR